VYLSQIIDEGIFKAGAERSEMWEAAEVQEDEDTQVELPVDQVIFTPLNMVQTHNYWLLFKFHVTYLTLFLLLVIVKPSQVLSSK
jgi:hypothetical protein